MSKRIIVWIILSLFCVSVTSLAESQSSLKLKQHPTLKPETVPTNVKLLFVQIAKSGEISAVKDKPYFYKLTLKQVDPYLSYFVEQPPRQTGLVKTKEFFKNWQIQPNIQKAPPTVAIETVDQKTNSHINQVFELTNPVYQSDLNQVAYDARLLANPEVLHQNFAIQPISLSYTVLFIDDFHWKAN